MISSDPPPIVNAPWEIPGLIPLVCMGCDFRLDVAPDGFPESLALFRLKRILH
jgi:hypothetical protein